MADQIGPRCGNNPKIQLTPGDRKALDDFRAFLEQRAVEADRSQPTVSEADAERLAALADCTDGSRVGLHCDHYQEGDGACCSCGRPNWCPDGGVVSSAGSVPAADQAALRNRITQAIADALKPRYGGPQHNTPGGLPLTATAEELRLHRAQPLADAVLAVLPATITKG